MLTLTDFDVNIVKNYKPLRENSKLRCSRREICRWCDCRLYALCWMASRGQTERV